MKDGRAHGTLFLTLTLTVAMLLAVFASTAGPAGAVDTGSISGTLTDSAGDPLTESCVEVYDADGNTEGGAITNSGGEYSVDGMGTGNYRLEFWGCDDDVAPEFYDDEATLAEATPVAVTSGAETAGIDAELAPAGSISGTVTDSTNAPVNRGCVWAYDSSGTEVGFDLTDSLGNYSIGKLRAGDHRLQFRGCAGNDVAGEFYSDKQFLGQADPVPVAAGTDTSGIDAQLQKPGGSISGKVTNDADEPVDHIRVIAYDATGMEVERDGTDSDGDYRLKGLATGDYRLEFEVYPSSANLLGEFYDDEPTLAEATPVAVTVGADTPDVNASLATGGSVSGEVTGNFNAPAGAICLFGVAVYDSTGEVVGSSYGSTSGLFKIDQLETGSYRLGFSGSCAVISAGGFVTPAGEAYTEFFDDVPSLAEATPVSVTAGSDTAGIYAHLGPGSPPARGSISDPGVQPGLKPPAGPGPEPSYRAVIGKVGVRGPARVKRGDLATYRVTIVNAGDAEATGLRLRVKGRGVSSVSPAGNISAGDTRTVKVDLKPRKLGRTKVGFRVTSMNAGSKSVKRRITVKRR